MSSESVMYIDAKARVVRTLNLVSTYVKAATEYSADRTNTIKRAKIKTMLIELTDIRHNVESDIQTMESAVSNKIAPESVCDNKASSSLIDSFHTMYYELTAFADVHGLKISSSQVQGSSSNRNCSDEISGQHSMSHFMLPKRKFPTFSGTLTEWQGFEDLFKSILSHSPELPDVERFEYLKTSLEGEALSIISHLSLTAANYASAWDLLQARYGNKRDLARVHLDALLEPMVVKSNNATSIKNLLNSILEHTAALDNLTFVTRSWSPLLIHIFEKHLDYELRSRWEMTVGDQHLPQVTDFVDFLRSHLRSAEVWSGHGSTNVHPSKTPRVTSIVPFKQSPKPRYGTYPKILVASTESQHLTCQVCTKSHSVRKCPLFLTQTSNERFQTAKTHRLCINCLGLGHSSIACPSKYKCQTCNKPHHSLLHFGSTSPTPQPVLKISTSQNEASTSSASFVVRGQPTKVILLSTTILEVQSRDGRRHRLRALLDSGAQASFITEKSACALMLHKQHSSITITTFASTSSTHVRGKSTITIMPCGKTTPSFCIDSYIVPSITGLSPQLPITPGQWPHLNNLPLADPSYHTPGEIDLLLGADILPSLLLDGRYSGQYGDPFALETVFGWILMGPVNVRDQSAITSLCLSVSEPLDATLKKFWELEELPLVRH